jgi:hypothetical protein
MYPRVRIKATTIKAVPGLPITHGTMTVFRSKIDSLIKLLVTPIRKARIRFLVSFFNVPSEEK